jgi:hypothetical protein
VQVQKVGSRGYLFTWVDPYRTNVYVINGKVVASRLDERALKIHEQNHKTLE